MNRVESKLTKSNKKINIMSKKLIIAIALICPVFLSAQNFEGVIKFSMEYKGTNADMIKSQAPSSHVVTIKGNNSKVVMEGGIMGAMIGDIINKGDEKNTYFVQSSQKTVYKTKSDEVKDNKFDDDATVTKENSTATILGYKCQKYKVVTKSGTNYVWATTEINVGTANYKGKISYKGIDGIMMKQEINISDKEASSYTVTMTMVAIDKKTVSDSEFTIPADYTVTEGIPPLLKMQMGK